MKKILCLVLSIFLSASVFAEMNLQIFSSVGPYQFADNDSFFTTITTLGVCADYEYDFEPVSVFAGLGYRDSNPYIEKLYLKAGVGKEFALGEKLQIDLKLSGEYGVITNPNHVFGANITAQIERKEKSGFFAGFGANLIYTPKYKFHGTSLHPDFPIFVGYSIKAF